MEQSLKKMAKDDFDVSEQDKEERGRIDIRYATSGGEHIIVELKRYQRKVDIDELTTQGGRYAVALKKVLDQQQRAGERIEVVFVLGEKPAVKAPHIKSDDEYIAAALEQINGRYVLYDALIENALNQYQEYLEASEHARKLDELLRSIDAPEDDGTNKTSADG